MIETIRSQNDVRFWELLLLSTVLDKGKGLHLLDGCGCTILLTPEEGIILLGHLETENGIADEDCDGDHSAED